MKDLFEIRPVDTQFYADRLSGFLPDRIIDIHTHVWLEQFRKSNTAATRTATWPRLVASENSIEDLNETYRLMFPGKEVTPMIFSNVEPDCDIDAANAYVSKCAKEYDLPCLLLAKPQWSSMEFESRILAGGFVGAKVYLTMADPAIATNEIEIFDFLPRHQLEILDKHGWIAMLHVPRDKRLRDPLNLAQMLEIENTFMNVRLIIAHVGRAYCVEDIGPAFDVLAKTKRIMFDISANTNRDVFRGLIEAVGPKRIMFGSDLPITRMRMRRITENGVYINLVPAGLYGDVSKDANMRQIKGEEADKFTFFLYEEIDSFRRAAEAIGLTKTDIEDIFHNNARAILP